MPEDNTPDWPGPNTSTALRHQWHRAHARIRELDQVRRALEVDLETARAELTRIEELARRAKAAEVAR